MTQVLSAVRHRELCKTDFDLDGGVRGEHHDSHRSSVDTLDGRVWESRTRSSRARAQPHRC